VSAATASAPAATRRGGRQRFTTAPRDLGVRDTRWTVRGAQEPPAGPRRSAAPATPHAPTWTEAAELRRGLDGEGLRLTPETASGGAR
jgi:hypothetical protein